MHVCDHCLNLIKYGNIQSHTVKTCSAHQKYLDAMKKEDEGDGKPNYRSSYNSNDYFGYCDIGDHFDCTGLY